MNRQKKFEIGVGVLVLMTVVALFFIALKVSNFTALQDRPTYQISALFENIGGLKKRAPVKMSGVVIGRVSQIVIDPVTYKAKVIMEIDQEFNNLPLDTSGAILTSGLLGDQYIGVTPGADIDFLQAGDQLEFTQSALVLEELIGQFLVKMSEK